MREDEKDGGYIFMGEWQCPRDLYEEMRMFEEAQRRSSSESELEDSEPMTQGECARQGCPYDVDFVSHVCINCHLEFCHFCSFRCYVTECRDCITSGHWFCEDCMDQHNLVVHSRIRDDRIGDGPPSDGSPTTAPRSEGPPESDALDTVFGEEEALGEGGTNLDSTQGGSQDGDTGPSLGVDGVPSLGVDGVPSLGVDSVPLSACENDESEVEEE